ncbi:hypothetical protein NQ314_010803, partial [Rhamnusium bicolor]
MEDLKKSRGVIKGKLTRLNHFLEQIDRGHLDDSIISKLNVWLDKIEPCWDQFEEIQSQIEGLDDDTETSINEREQFENSYISVVGDKPHNSLLHLEGFSNQVQQNRVEAASPDFTTAGGARSETPEDVNHQAGTSGVPGPNVSINSHSLNRIATAPVGSQILLATAIIKRVLAYVLRFINNARSTYNDRLFGALTPTELEGSLNSLIKGAQIECFPNEYHNLQNKRELSEKSKILALNPFMHNQLIRVVRRIINSKHSFDKKHSIILPQGHKLTQRILEYEHKRLMHCGAQNLLCS